MKKNENLCPYCQKEMKEIVRIIKNEYNKKIKTENTTFICTNPKCILFIDYSRIKNWKIL
ncbi:MAG: hypothetical protein QW469_00330 [Candidatus Aenigmatarchaeota archaeon]